MLNPKEFSKRGLSTYVLRTKAVQAGAKHQDVRTHPQCSPYKHSKAVVDSSIAAWLGEVLLSAPSAHKAQSPHGSERF